MERLLQLALPFNYSIKQIIPFGFGLAPYIIPISISVHLLLLNAILWIFTPDTYLNLTSILYYNISWLVIAAILDYFQIRRIETFTTKINKYLSLYLLFGVSYIALFAIRSVDFSLNYQLITLGIVFGVVTIHRMIFYWFRSLYRIKGGNFVNVVLIGEGRNMGKLRKFFSKPELGYRLKGYFDTEESGRGNYLGDIDDCYEYILNNSIDEIYCLASKLSEDQLKDLLKFADNNFKKVKIIPDSKGVYTKTMDIDLYGSIPVINLRELKVHSEYGKVGKRMFDIVFSLLVIIFILSWLTPLLYVIIKMESKGPLFFKQLRNGHKKQTFHCLKFRSMKVNSEAHKKMGEKNDPRLTRVGAFLRKTNIDELPQFFNVLAGDMTVVGPRPHMELHTEEYTKSVDKYLVRHFSKPGITGLAQVRGYRGEIENKYDIINRVKLDIFYLEKVCFLFDLKIIFETLFKTLSGDKKAY